MTTFSFRDAERRLWLHGAEAFRELLHPRAIMSLPMPSPVIEGEAIASSIKDFPRWDEITMRSLREADEGDSHIIAYQAEARRGDETYACACLSTWILCEDGWRLLAHAQVRPRD